MARFSEIAIDKSMRLITRGLAAGRLRTVAWGLENVPDRGPALIVARHYHHLYDGLSFFTALRRPFHIVVTLDWVKNRRSRFFMSRLTRIARWPVLLRSEAVAWARTRGTEFFSSEDVRHYQRKALRQAADLLVEGRLVVIFPEGFPNIDPHYTPKTSPEELLPFKAGFVSIVASAERRLSVDVPMIPAGICYRKGNPWIGNLSFGTPIYRADHWTRALLLACLEKEVKRLSDFGSRKT